MSTPGARSIISLGLKIKIHFVQKDFYGEKEVLNQIGILFKTKANVNSFGKKAFNKLAPNKKVLTENAKKFFSNLDASYSRRPGHYFCLEMGALDVLLKIIAYLTLFPLKTSKYIAFKRWSRVVFLFQKNYHRIEENVLKLIRLTTTINRYSKLLSLEKTKKEELSKSEDFLDN
jgi:hypothetical protein